MTTYNENSSVKSVDGFYKDGNGNVVTKRLSTTRTRSRTLSKSINTSALYSFLAILLCLFLGGIILSSNINFSSSVFDSFENYSSFNVGLPRLQIVLDKLSTLPAIPSITEFFNYQFIVGDWGVLEGLRGFINVITSPFMFAGHLTSVILAFLPALISVFIP